MSKIILPRRQLIVPRRVQRGFIINPYVFGGAAPTDPLFANVVSLCHFNGPDSSTTITDQVAAAWTASNVFIKTAQSKFGGASLENPNTSTGTCDSPTSATFTLGTGDFTIEFWFYANATPGTDFLLDSRPVSTQGAYPVIYCIGSTIHYYVNTANRITGTAAIANTTWQHVAVCRASGTTRMFINGVQVGSDWADSTNYVNTSFRLANGRFTSGQAMNGFLDDWRVTTAARYTANFTPPTAQFPDS